MADQSIKNFSIVFAKLLDSLLIEHINIKVFDKVSDGIDSVYEFNNSVYQAMVNSTKFRNFPKQFISQFTSLLKNEISPSEYEALNGDHSIYIDFFRNKNEDNLTIGVDHWVSTLEISHSISGIKMDHANIPLYVRSFLYDGIGTNGSISIKFNGRMESGRADIYFIQTIRTLSTTDNYRFKEFLTSFLEKNSLGDISYFNSITGYFKIDIVNGIITIQINYNVLEEKDYDSYMFLLNKFNY